MADEKPFPSSEARAAYVEAERIILADEHVGVLSLRGDNEGKLNELDRLPPQIRNLKALLRLDLRVTEVSDLTPISSLHDITDLYLDFTQVADLEPIRNMRTMKGLELPGTQVSDLSPLQGMPILSVLILDGTPVSDLTALEALENMKFLSLERTLVSDLEPLSGLNRMRYLNINGTSVSDLRSIEKMSDLVGLSLAGTPVRDLKPLSNLRAMAEWAIASKQLGRLGGNLDGLYFRSCPNLPEEYQAIATIENNKERTLKALNQIRKDAGLSSVEDWLAEDESASPNEKPGIPNQEDGLSFETTESGRIGLASSGQPTPDDVDELEGIKPTLIAAVEALEAACDGSNAFQHFKPVATRYRAALEGETTQLSIDRLVAEGTWLENANMRLQAEIASEHLPEQGNEIGAAMDTVIALHGMSVMGTTRGRQLIQRNLDYQMDRADIEEAKARTSEFAERVKRNSELFEPEVGEIAELASSEINEGPHPERSTDTARGFQSNILRVLGYTIMTGAVWPVVSSGVSNSQLGSAASSEITLIMDAARAFWLTNQTLILKMAAAWGTDLNWVQALYRWLGTNHTITKDEE
ncbi:MAG: leucine-rich repeat domain-containing protein [Pseudomonadota bacterium]